MTEQKRHWREKVYPEVGAGGFSSVDSIVEFYGRINALLTPDMVVLDYGAGRGREATDDTVDYRRRLRNLRGKARSIVGVDIDPIVGTNPSVDSAVLIQEDSALPFASSSFDMIMSDFTFEHIRDSLTAAAELDRVLKPGGWLCARTPNRWGYIAVGASLVPNHYHVSLLRSLQPHRESRDIFPTAYRLNSRKALASHFPAARYANFSYYFDPEPAYFGTGAALNAVARCVLRRVPSRCSALLLVFLQKRVLAPKA